MPDCTIAFVLPAAGHWIFCAKKVGFKLLWAYETGKWESRVIKLNFSDLLLYKEFPSKIDEVPDLIVGSPPCKAFSTAKHKNFDPLNPAVNGIREYFGLINKIQPKFFILENVRGLLTVGKSIFEESMKQIPQYKKKVVILNAMNYGSCQDRIRVFIFGSKNFKGEWPILKEEKLITMEEVLGDLEKLPLGTRPHHQTSKTPCILLHCGKGPVFLSDEGVYLNYDRRGDRQSRTLTSSAHSMPHYNLPRRFSLLELMRIMGLPEDWKFPSKSSSRNSLLIAEGVDCILATKILIKTKQIMEKNYADI